MYTVGVIGLGQIAAMYFKPGDENPFCHVGGINLSDRVKLKAVTDILAPAMKKFKDCWGGCFPDLAYYENVTQMLANGPYDIVAVCVKGPRHFEVMMEVIKAGPRFIFLEKPPTCSLEEMDTVLAASRAKQISIMASYTRHFCPYKLRLQELVQKEGIIGEVQKVVAYTGGLYLSFSSHVVDLICQYAGYDPQAIFARGHFEKQATPPAGYEREPNIDAAIIEFKSGITGIHVGQDGEHGSMYADVFGTKGMVRAGYYTPPFIKIGEEVVDVAKYNMPGHDSVFRVAYGQIADYLDGLPAGRHGGPLPHCTNEAWIAVHELCLAGIESMLTSQRIELPNQNRSRKIYAMS